VQNRLGTPGDDAAYPTSPIEETCQKNIVILITTGSQDSDTHFSTLIIDDLVGEDGNIYVDDVAKYLNSPDKSRAAGEGIGTLVNGAIENTEGVQTYVVQLLTPTVPRLVTAAETVGGGKHLPVSNNRDLVKALSDAFVNILLETDTAFVAPVVPTSPENRTYSGQRVYLGFFYPQNDEPWHGNLKKFSIDAHGEITDKDGELAVVQSGVHKGSFRDQNLDDLLDEATDLDYTASSFWSTNDAGRVSKGGVGKILHERTTARNIYTYLTVANSSVGGTNEDLWVAQNQFSTTNTDILFDTTLGLSDAADKDKLIQFVHGLDSYDDNGNSDTTEKRPWIMGDILHSKPLVVNYTSYQFTDENEACAGGYASGSNINKGVVFVGANDGMLHAFADCDGEELWAFIPPEVLPNLQEVRGAKHPTFVDGSPVVYIYDKDHDGNIETADGDKVILIFGMRRGGEAYYALDVTEPDKPKYMWQVDKDTGFPELGQTWSTPNLGIVKNSSNAPVVVAFVGAGYDNLNEDGRYGATQGFTNTDVVTTEDGSGDVQSVANVTPDRDGNNPVTNHPKGRGVYAIKIADVNATTGVPTIAPAATMEWDFVYGDAVNTDNSLRLTYSFPSDITVLDTDYDGFVDRLYAGDSGGQMWRFSAYGTDGARSDGLGPYATPEIEEWYGKRMFLANGGGDGTNGRKIFYRPSVTQQTGGVINLYFGTGDRAHPLNSNVIDRMYAVYDRDQVTSDMTDEDDLEDVTDNILQGATTSLADITAKLNALSSTSNYGWFIELEEAGHEGEKVLAPALAFNKVAYYTTYAPAATNTSPCDPGNLGLSRLYAVDYLTGEAVLNFDNVDNKPTTHNDDQLTDDNKRADDGKGNVLRRTDRTVELGVGIPSGIVVLMPPSGDSTLLIGCGGGLCSEDPAPGGTIYPIYWRPY
jgi:type IV pilus assembly protein PilY1